MWEEVLPETDPVATWFARDPDAEPGPGYEGLEGALGLAALPGPAGGQGPVPPPQKGRG